MGNLSNKKVAFLIASQNFRDEEYFQPKVYFIENPYYSAMKDIPNLKLIKSFII